MTPDETPKCDEPRHRAAAGAVVAGLAALLLLAGCRSEMYEQPRYEPLEPSSFFEDGRSSRPLVAGTVPREDARGAPPDGRRGGRVLHRLVDKGRLAETVPFPVDRAVLERGQERYRIYCTPCHGESGDGRGMIVRRGFNPPPPYYSEELRKQPIGHFFDVMTRGYGTMYSYASRIPPRDRWAIAAYIRVLQLSQHATAAELPEEDRSQLPAEDRELSAGGPSHERRSRIEDARRRAAAPPGPHPVAGAGRRRGGAGRLRGRPGCSGPAAFFPAYLVGYVFWVGIALGCLGLTMLHHLVGGSWGLLIRRPMESAGITLLPLAILFLPLALGLPRLYRGRGPRRSRTTRSLQAKSSYLNAGFFLVRTGALFRDLDRPGARCSAGSPPRRTGASDHGPSRLAAADWPGRD